MLFITVGRCNLVILKYRNHTVIQYADSYVFTLTDVERFYCILNVFLKFYHVFNVFFYFSSNVLHLWFRV